MSARGTKSQDTRRDSGARRAVTRDEMATQPPCYLSIDFEDYAHDYQRALGVKAPRRTPDALWKAYEEIDAFSRAKLRGARLTFFTTGQVARDFPEIVAAVASDGHEIACHHCEHDQIWHQDRRMFRADLRKAVEYLSEASGQKVLGFRAPDFSIDSRCAHWAYEEISRQFIYDSSHVTDQHIGPASEPAKYMYGDSTLYEFPIYCRRFAGGLPVRVIGGTYFRFLPLRLISKLLHEASARGFVPQIYLHPYDLLHEHEQWSCYADLGDLGLAKRLLAWSRQHQWHSIGNRSAFEKLEGIYDEFTHPGTFSARLASTMAKTDVVEVAA